MWVRRFLARSSLSESICFALYGCCRLLFSFSYFVLLCFVLFFFCYTGEVFLHSNSTTIAEMLLLNVANWKRRNGKRRTGNGKRETGNVKRETGNVKRETGNGKRETVTGNGEPVAAVFPIKMLNFTNMNPSCIFTCNPVNLTRRHTVKGNRNRAH